MPQLDVLRTLAVVLVLGRHLTLNLSNQVPTDLPAILHPFFECWIRVGWIGVDLFFVLSGFLVSGLLFREWQESGKISYLRFFVRRGFKIYPAFYALMILTALLTPAQPGAEGRWLAALFHECFFLQNYSTGFWLHTWSLAVEEHFYLILPLTLVCLARIGKSAGAFQKLPLLVLGISMIALSLRCLNALRAENSFDLNLLSTHLRVDSLFFGVLISYWYHFRRAQLEALARKSTKRLLVLIFFCLTPPFFIPVENRFMHTFGLTLLYLGFGTALVLLLTTPFAQKDRLYQRLAPISLLGGYSYSIYLWHLPVRMWGISLLTKLLGRPAPSWLEYLTYLGGSLVVGVFMAKIIEIPALRYRERNYPGAQQAIL